MISGLFMDYWSQVGRVVGDGGGGAEVAPPPSGARIGIFHRQELESRLSSPIGWRRFLTLITAGISKQTHPCSSRLSGAIFQENWRLGHFQRFLEKEAQGAQTLDGDTSPPPFLHPLLHDHIDSFAY